MRTRTFALAASAAPLTLSLLLVALAPSAAAAAWLPLAVGNQWVYMDDADEPHTETITSIGSVRGRHVFVKEYAGGIDDGLLNFWQIGSDGSVLLCGYYKPWYPFGLLYEPPVRIFPGQPVLDLEWDTHTVAYSVPDNVYYGSFDTYWKVRGEYTFTVPAGTFPCFGVAQVAPPAVVVNGQALGLDGRVLPGGGAPSASGPASAAEWYSNGTGVVESDTGVVYILQSVGGPTPARASSWGRIKGLYR